MPTLTAARTRRYLAIFPLRQAGGRSGRASDSGGADAAGQSGGGSRRRGAAVKVGEWRARLATHRAPRIGLVWSGSGANVNDPARSIALEKMLAFLPHGPSYVSVQKDLPLMALAARAVRQSVVFLGAAIPANSPGFLGRAATAGCRGPAATLQRKERVRSARTRATTPLQSPRRS